MPALSLRCSWAWYWCSSEWRRFLLLPAMTFPVGEQAGLKGNLEDSFFLWCSLHQSAVNPLFSWRRTSPVCLLPTRARHSKLFWPLWTTQDNLATTLQLTSLQIWRLRNPQARHRYILVGFRESLGLEFKVPKTVRNIQILVQEAFWKTFRRLRPIRNRPDKVQR